MYKRGKSAFSSLKLPATNQAVCCTFQLDLRISTAYTYIIKVIIGEGKVSEFETGDQCNDWLIAENLTVRLR